MPDQILTRFSVEQICFFITYYREWVKEASFFPLFEDAPWFAEREWKFVLDLLKIIKFNT